MFFVIVPLAGPPREKASDLSWRGYGQSKISQKIQNRDSPEKSRFSPTCRALASVDSISDRQIRKSRQNVISLFQPNETLCEVILSCDDIKRHFFQFLVFLSHSTRISGLPIMASRLCAGPKYSEGLFLPSKLKGFKVF